MPGAEREILEIRIPIDSDEELKALRGALIAARASELGELRRRDHRLTAGYGDPGSRESMTAEVIQRQRRLAMLDRLLGALDEHVSIE